MFEGLVRPYPRQIRDTSQTHLTNSLHVQTSRDLWADEPKRWDFLDTRLWLGNLFAIQHPYYKSIEFYEYLTVALKDVQTQGSWRTVCSGFYVDIETIFVVKYWSVPRHRFECLSDTLCVSQCRQFVMQTPLIKVRLQRGME